MNEDTDKEFSRSQTASWPADDLPPEACSPAMRRHALGLVPYFRGLAAVELETVHAAFHARHMLPGATLVSAGDPAERLTVIVSGRVKLVTDGASGSAHLVDVSGRANTSGRCRFWGRTPTTAARRRSRAGACW